MLDFRNGKKNVTLIWTRNVVERDGSDGKVILK